MHAKRIALALVIVIAIPVHAALVAGAERRVALPSHAGALQSWATDVATDGTDYLVTWVDSTTGREGFYATPVDANGVPRGAPPSAFLTSQMAWKGAHAVWTGDAYLVIAYEENDLNRTQYTNRAVRIDRDGRVLGAALNLPVGGVIRSLSWNGTRVLAIYEDVAARQNRAAMLDAHGRIVKTGIQLPTGTSSEAVAAGDGFIGFRVVTESAFPAVSKLPVAAFRISAEGEIGASVTVAEVGIGSVTMHADSAGGRVGLAVMVGFQTTRELRRFTIDAATLAVETHPLIALPQQTQTLEVVASAGGFTAAWGYFTGNAQRLDAIAFDASTTPRTLHEGNGAALAQIAANASTALTALTAAPVLGVVFDAALTRKLTEPRVITLAGVRQILPAVATTAAGSMVAWIDQTAAPGGTVFVRRFDAAGNAIDAAPIAVGEGSISGNVAVTFTGKVWLVAWQNGLSEPTMRVLVRRIAADGTLLDAEPIDTGSGTQPALASNGTVTVLARAGLFYAAINVLAFSPDGVLLDPTPRVLTTKYAGMPAVGSNGREFAVVWRGTNAAEFGIFAARLSENGSVLDPTPIAITQPPSPTVQQNYPGVSSIGDDFVIVYGTAKRDGPQVIAAIESKRLLRNGALADTVASADGTVVAVGANPRIAAVGGGYVVTYIGAGQALMAVRTDERGQPTHEPRLVQGGELYAATYALAAHGGAAWVVYTRYDESLERAQRVFMRPVADGPGPKRRTARK